MITGSPSRQIMLRVIISHPAPPSTWTQITLNNSYHCLLNRLPSCWVIAGRPAPSPGPWSWDSHPSCVPQAQPPQPWKTPRHLKLHMDYTHVVEWRISISCHARIFFSSKLKRMNIDWFDWFCVCVFILSKQPWSYTCINLLILHLWIITHNYYNDVL